MATWSEETEVRLINLIQERPALYDITERRYSNRVVKAHLWREIEDKLVVSEKELRKKWDSLRTQYTRYKKLAPLGSCRSQKTGRQQWILTQLQFLEPHTRSKESSSNLTVTEPSQAAESDSHTDGQNSETSISSLEEPCIKDELRPNTPLPESINSGTESTQMHLRGEPSPKPRSNQPGTPRPRMKRSRKALDKSASEESAKLMRTIGKTLEKLASREDQNDVITTYCRNFEQRARTLPTHLLPHFLHEVDNCLFKYSVMASTTDVVQL